MFVHNGSNLELRGKFAALLRDNPRLVLTNFDDYMPLITERNAREEFSQAWELVTGEAIPAQLLDFLFDTLSAARFYHNEFEHLREALSS